MSAFRSPAWPLSSAAFSIGSALAALILLAPRTPIRQPYLLAFHACDTGAFDCNNPRNGQVYLTQSRDGASWSIAPGWQPFVGSVPDVIHRDDTLSLQGGPAAPALPLQHRQLGSTTVTLEDSEPPFGYVDPSLILDWRGRIGMDYLPGIPRGACLALLAA